MSNARDENDEPGLGDFGENSLTLGLDWVRVPKTDVQVRQPAGGSAPDFWADSGGSDEERPDVVAFDPLGFGIATQLEQMGIPVRVATTPVEVMMLAASRPTGAVACGPAADAERRRMLTAAIRSRFPWVGVLYFSTHGRKPGALLAAKGEGAHELVPLPLPHDNEVRNIFAQYVVLERPRGAHTDEDPDHTPFSGSDEFVAFADTRVRTSETTVRAGAVPRQPEVGDDSFSSPTEVIVPRRVLESSDESVPTTFDPFEGLPKTAFDRPEPQQKGEVGQLMGAISPFLWGLEDAARWAEGYAAKGDTAAAVHAQTLKVLANLLAQLQERIEDKGL